MITMARLVISFITICVSVLFIWWVIKNKPQKRKKPSDVFGIRDFEYRVIRKRVRKEYLYAIHEVFYDEDGKILSVTEQPEEPFGFSLDELDSDLRAFMAATTSPVLEDDGNGNFIEVHETRIDERA